MNCKKLVTLKHCEVSHFNKILHTHNATCQEGRNVVGMRERFQSLNNVYLKGHGKLASRLEPVCCAIETF
jgi:hypothetical protein